MDQRVQLIIALMGEDLGRDVPLDELARAVSLSPSRLHHLFKAETGTAPAHYLRALRMERARDLLLTTTLSIKGIMRIVGVTDRSHFDREFKRAYGVTPAKCRATAMVASEWLEDGAGRRG